MEGSTITAFANFEGETDASGRKHGWGKLTWDDGDCFEGEFKDDEKVRGTFHWGTGDSYEGQWLQDLMHGQGRYDYADGRSYLGNWEKGYRHGHGAWLRVCRVCVVCVSCVCRVCVVCVRVCRVSCAHVLTIVCAPQARSGGPTGIVTTASSCTTCATAWGCTPTLTASSTRGSGRTTKSTATASCTGPRAREPKVRKGRHDTTRR
jgi:hypothetical protein